MIEAQSLYINALIKEVKNARDKGGSLRIEPKQEIVQKYNKDIQARLAQSAFADPNCNSWYKNEAGLITNNWSDGVIPYQKRTSSIHWKEYDIRGTGEDQIKKRGYTQWPRVVEETQISDTVILTGLGMAAAAAALGIFYRGTRKSILK
jgi:hypothetical protein